MDHAVPTGKFPAGDDLRATEAMDDSKDDQGRVAENMTYQEMSELKKGDRFQVFHHGEWKSGTFQGTVNGSDPAMWFTFDEREQYPGSLICTRIFTGLQFTEEYWNSSKKDRKFRKLSEDDLNAELIEKMGVAE